MTDTYTLAFEACGRQFVETGKMPTVESIKEAIGIKSPTTISTAIKDWKATLAKSVEENQAAIAGIPPTLKDAFVAVWQQAQAESAHAYRERLADLTAREAALAAKEQGLAAEHDRIGQWVALTEQRYQEEATLLKKDIARLTEETAAWKEAGDHHRHRATEAEKDNAVLAEEIRQEKEKFSRLETQYDREHDWALKRIEEEKETHRQQTKHEMNRLQSETARNKQAAEMTHAKLEHLGQQVNEYRDMTSQLEGNLAKEKLKLAELTLDKANLQSQLNTKEEKIRLLLAKKTKLITQDRSQL
jgi:chromosome segregation ATPase